MKALKGDIVITEAIVHAWFGVEIANGLRRGTKNCLWDPDTGFPIVFQNISKAK